jgi:hypothetical protein
VVGHRADSDLCAVFEKEVINDDQENWSRDMKIQLLAEPSSMGFSKRWWPGLNFV